MQLYKNDVHINYTYCNERLFWLKLNVFCIQLFYGWLPSCILWFLSVNFPILGSTNYSKRVIYLFEKMYNLLWSNANYTFGKGSVSLSPLLTDRQPFIRPGDGKQLWGGTNLAVRPASVTERPHESNWQHSFRSGLGQQEYVYKCVCVHLRSAYFMVVYENRKLWLAFTWFT